MNAKRIFLGIFLTLIMLVAYFPETSAAPSSRPRVLGWTTYGIGSGSYVMSVIFAEAVEDISGWKIKAIPSGTDVGKLLPVINGEAHVSFLTGSGAYFASVGLGPFLSDKWGPQKLRVLYKGWDSENTFTVKGNSSIKTGADIKGKKVANIPGNVSVNRINTAYLAFHGLTWNDVVKVNVSGFGQSLSAIAAGSIDTSMGGTTAEGVWTMHSSPDGVRFIPMPASDTAGWERLKAVCPFMYPHKMAAGLAAVDPSVAVEGAGYPGLMPMAYDTLEDEIAYTVTKALHLRYDSFKDRYTRNDEYQLQRFADDLLKLTIPAHPGTIKYLKEVKVWTAEHDAYLSELLRMEEERFKAWKAALAEAKAKGISTKPTDEEWINLWEVYLGKVK